jgi:hypothetical protein
MMLLLLTGCASAPVVEGSDSTPRQAAMFSSPETGLLLADRPRASKTEVAAPPQAVWAAVKKVYADLDIPVTIDNAPGHQLGNNNFWKTRQMAGEQMNMLVDCGSGMTGPKAATYRIYMISLTDVNPDGKGGTLLQTTFVPTGQDVAGGSSDRIPCGTTGRFEQIVLDKIKQAVGAPIK